MKANKSRHIGLSALTVALLGVAAAVFVAVGAVSFIAVYGQAMTADTATRAEQATRQTAAALENYLSNMEEKLNRIAAEITADSLGSARDWMLPCGSTPMGRRSCSGARTGALRCARRATGR